MKLKSLNKLGFMLMSLGIIVLIALTLRAITPATQSLPLRDVSPLKAAIPALDSPRDRVMAAWDQAREAGAYDFSADILQKTIPLPSPTNVGRTSKTERLHLEGHTNLPGRTMQLTLWTEGGNILDAHSGLEVKVEDERVLARQGSGDWQEINNFTGLFAPDGDFMAFLSAAKEIASHGSETRAGVPFSRYTFQVDGPGYAAYLRNQLEREMAAKGELPPGISLDLPRQYVDMTGTGELWLSQDGLPLRQLIHLSFPPSADQDHRLEAEIRVDFANFGQAGKTTATRDVNPTADSQQPTADSRQPMLLLIIALLLYTMLRFIRRHSRNLYMGATSVVIVSMLLSPLMQNHHVSAFYARQRAELEAQEGLQQESNMMQTLSTLYETRPGPRPAAAVSASSRRAGSLALIRADDGSDADSDGMTDIGEAFLGSNPFGPDRSEQPAIIQAAAVDTDGDLLPDANDPCPADPDCDDDGLTDYEETLLGTDLFSPDTDGDLISDTLEVEGFFANGQTWYSDPLEVDSNRDGLGDAQEWRFSDANWDTDGDGAPDLHDRDNDGDGVPDNLDLSPFANFPQIFSRDDPFELLVENLASRPAYIEFQLRPTNPDHLWYTYNVLDWPRYDISGQMQDEDGWTFHDYCVHNSLLQGQNLNAQCPLTPDDNGDLKLIPSLEIEFDFDSIPPTSSFFKELDAYSISRRYASDFQKATYIVPLQLVTDNQGGEQVAFYGKFFFRQSGSWGAAHKIRFAWIVQALVDNACVQQDSSGNCVLKQDNVLQPIHAYYDDWQLTGFNIQENHGTDVAQIFEDPAVDPDLQRDDALLGLANGLDQSLLAGRPNPNFPDQRNPRVLSLKIKFDHLASALQGPFRWNLPDILRVEKGTFPRRR